MSFGLTILGSSSALPTSERYPTAQVLRVPGRYFLIDCGEGTQIQIRRNHISFGRIKHVFISHLHGDHYYGLIGLISTMNLLGIRNDLHIYAPSELKTLIQPQLDHIRGEMLVRPVFHPLDLKKPRQIFADKQVEVISFPVKHSIPACGFLFRETARPANMIREMIIRYKIPVARMNEIKNGADFITEDGEVIPHHVLTTPPPPPRSYAFCTDTAFCPQNAEIIAGADLLYHEATFSEDLRELADKTGHSTAADAARMAALAKVKRLIIGHFSARYKTPAPLLDEARTIFENTVAASDGETYPIG